MHRYIATVIALTSLMFCSGCATESATSGHRPKEPFPGPMNFTGDMDKTPVMRFMPLTVFPPFLIERGVSGSATISFKVKADGYVEEAKVESATEPAFGSSALGTIGRTVFRPATKNGVPVPVTGTVTFPFEYE
jgi:TonB family protein